MVLRQFVHRPFHTNITLYSRRLIYRKVIYCRFIKVCLVDKRHRWFCTGCLIISGIPLFNPSRDIYSGAIPYTLWQISPSNLPSISSTINLHVFFYSMVTDLQWSQSDRHKGDKLVNRTKTAFGWPLCSSIRTASFVVKQRVSPTLSVVSGR